MHHTSLVASFAAVTLPPSAAAAVQSGDPAALAAVSRELFPYLLQVPDPRGRQGRRYELVSLLVLCLMGFCGGCLGYLSVARWAAALKPATLRELGFTWKRTPCAATWLNLFRVLDWDGVARQFQAWAEAACLPVPAAGATPEVVAPEVVAPEVVAPDEPPPPVVPPTDPSTDPAWQGLAIDGKTLRGSLAAGATVAHVVSIVAHGSGVSVRETGVKEKQGELTVAPDLLTTVLGPGRVITGDALFTQRSLCRQIVDGGSHYVLVVKENQPTLRSAVAAVLGAVTKKEARAQQRRSVCTVDRKHGRIENRYLLLAAVTTEQVDWPGVAQVFFLERQRYQPARGDRAAKKSREIVYGITSLGSHEAGPDTVLRLQRGHWSIENQVHWVLDTFFREDDRRIRDGRVARGMATLRRGALNLLRLLGRRSVPDASDCVKADPTLLFPLIGGPWNN